MILLEADKKLMRTSLPQGQRIIGKKDVKKKFNLVPLGLQSWKFSESGTLREALRHKT
jgi:hypothetical protein